MKYDTNIIFLHQYYFKIQKVSRLPILMYHNITLNDSNSTGLTLSASKFEEQLKYLKDNDFQTCFISELLACQIITKKTLVLTFDDVTENQLFYALPLLKKYNFKATFFIPFSFVGKSDLWNDGDEKIMSIDQLKSLDPEIIELAHHSFYHRKYSTLTSIELEEDLDKSFKFISENDLKVTSAIAYPYGNYPKKGTDKQVFFEILEKNNIKMAFRIGNRVNNFPLKNRFEVQRIDIKGEDSIFTFKWKLRVGKLRLF